MNSYLLKKIKKLNLKDFIGLVMLIIVLIPSLVFRMIKRKNLWLINEDQYGANDNGFVFYKYMIKNHKEINCVYVIDRDSEYFQRVSAYGKVIRWGSIKHWIYYLSADYIVSTQMGTSPNLHIIYPLEILGIIRNKRVFLQHGILLNYYPSLEYKNNKLSLFVCGAKPEYEFVRNTFGFPVEKVVYTGLARFDELHGIEPDNSCILIMPTWREWLVNSNIYDENNFTESEYFISYIKLLHNKRFIDYIEANNILVYFYLHRSMQKYVDCFKSQSNNIKILKRFDYDIQNLLKRGALMITDYSSVSMDFAYMKKPIIYYQFDEEQFRMKHGREGYFSYKKNGFGPVCESANEVVDKVISLVDHKFNIENLYRIRMNDFYELCDDKNCLRIYEAIKRISLSQNAEE